MRAFINVLAVLLASTACAQSAEQVRHVVQFYSAAGSFSGNVVFFREGQIVCNESRGLANRSWGVANAGNTRFAIGSVTKQFTAAAILLLQEQGRLKTSDPVNLYYKQAPAAWKDMTIRELLLHTSGMPEELFDSGSLGFEHGTHSPEEVVQAATQKPLIAPPGSRTAYNNAGYVLLGLIIERASGQTYRNSAGEEIDVAPAGGQLKLVPHASGKSASTLRAESSTRFYFAEWDGEVQFDRKSDGSLQMMIFAYPNETATVWSKVSTVQ